MHYAENECAMPIRLHCNELRARCLIANALCRTAEIGALSLKCELIVYIWPEKGVFTGLQYGTTLDSLSVICCSCDILEKNIYLNMTQARFSLLI